MDVSRLFCFMTVKEYMDLVVGRPDLDLPFFSYLRVLDRDFVRRATEAEIIQSRAACLLAGPEPFRPPFAHD